MKIHSSITMDRVVDGAEQSMLGDDYIGFCTRPTVYGAEELVLVML